MTMRRPSLQACAGCDRAGQVGVGSRSSSWIMFITLRQLPGPEGPGLLLCGLDGFGVQAALGWLTAAQPSAPRLAAFVSAFSEKPHEVQANTDWVRLFFLSIRPHLEHCCEV